MNVLNRQNRRIQRKLANLKNLHPLWVRTVAGLAAVVMFFTVYSLILPAAAATGDQATEESGFFLEESAAETEAKELAEAEPTSGGEAAQEAESPSGSSEEGSAGQQKSSSGSGESSSSSQPEALQAETSGSGSGWESIPQDNVTSVEVANTDNSGSTASGSGQNGTEEFVVSEQETNKSAEAAAVTEETVSETASQETKATTEEITEETSEELSEETEEEPVYTNTIETEDEKTGIKAKIVFDEEIVRDTDKLVLAAASDKKSDKEIVIPLEALEKGIAERCAEIVNKDLDDEEKKSADDIETVKAEFVGLTIEDKDGEEISLPANTRMRVEIVFPGSYETEDEEYQCVLMAEQSAKDYQDQLEKKAADDELVVSMEKLKADVSEQDQADGGKTVVSFETKELNSAGIVVFRVNEDDVEEESSDESEVSEESSETSEESSDESAETSEEVTDESSEEISESKETVSEDALAEVSAESTDEVTSETSSESEEAASEEETIIYEAGTLKADGGDYHITMSYAEDAKIPAGARLEVRELQERTREFNKLIGQYNKEFPDAKVETESSSAVVRGLKKAGDAVTGFIGGLLGIEKAPEPTSVQTARLFDITILDENGEEIEPSGTVQVDIQLDALQQVASESNVTLVHFEDKVNEVDASLSGETLSFETDSFSVYGVMYTVDFEYTDPESGETYYYSIEGGSKIKLSELFDILEVKYDLINDNDDVELTGTELAQHVTNVTFSNEELVKVTKDVFSNDWTIESLQPFTSEESLVVKVDDEGIIRVVVRDEYQPLGSNDISEALFNVAIEGAERVMEDGHEVYKIKKGEQYKIKLDFKEIQNGIQFPMDSTFSYTLPSGLNAAGQVGTLDSPDGVYGVHYSIDSNGVITFSWVIYDAEKFENVKNSNNVRIDMEIDATFNDNVTNLEFSDTITKTIEQNDDHDVSVTKYASYDYNTHKMTYSITVHSDGSNQNVVINDSFNSGNVFNSNHDVKLDGTPVEGVQYNGNSFSINVGSMAHNETRTYTYTADINESMLSQLENGEIKVEQTGNTVNVTSTTDNNPGNNTATGQFNNSIKVSSLGKAVESTSAVDENGYSTITWKVTANSEKLVHLTYVSDQIEEGSRGLLEYSGRGLHIVVEKEDGTTETRDIAWNTDGLSLDTATQKWTYNPPAGDGKAKYTITYETRGNGNNIISATDVNNDVDTDYNHADGTGKVKPHPQNDIALEKKVAKYDLGTRELNWEITFNVPKNGLDSATVTDTLPVTWIGEKYCVDSIESVSVLGLNEDEECTHNVVSHNNKEDQIVFTFGRLSGGETTRQIRILINTKLDETWLENEIAATHTNNVTLQTGNNSTSTSASVDVDQREPELLKEFGWEENAFYTVDGSNVTVKAYVYYLKLFGVTDNSFDSDGYLTVTDSYDSEYLTYYTNPPYNCYNGNITNRLGLVYGVINNGEKDSAGIAVDPSEGSTQFTLDKLTIPKREDGTYYPEYRIYYMLTIKDKATEDAMKAEAITKPGGKVTLHNTAKWGELSKEVDVDYKVPIVTKDILNADAVRNGETDTAQYRIVINANGERIGTSDYLEVTDDYSNQSIDYEEVKFDPADAVVEMNHSGNSISMILKNGIPITITYPARVLSSGTYKNTVTVNGQAVEKSDTANISSHGGTGYGNVSFRVMKYADGNMLDRLPGAVFELYEDGTKIGEYTTDADGMITLTRVTHADGKTSDLYRGIKYSLKEITAPAGYKEIGFDYQFQILTETEEQDPNVELYKAPDWRYLNHDVLTIAETPDEDDGMWVKVRKLWEGISSENLPESITIHLIQKQDRSTDNKDGTIIRTATLTSENQAADGTWNYTFTGLEKGYAYAIQEDSIPGFETVYEDRNTLGLISSGELSLTNTKKDITVKKVWENGEEPENLRGIDVNVLKDGEFFKKVTLEKTKNWTVSLNDLPWPATYTVQEPAVDGYTIDSIEYTDTEGNIKNALTESGAVTITNKKTPPDSKKTSIDVQKKWYKADGVTEITDEEQLKDLSATVRLVRYRALSKTTKVHFWSVNNNEWYEEKLTATIPQAIGVKFKFNASGYVQGGVIPGDVDKTKSASELEFVESFGNNPPVTITLDTIGLSDINVVARYTSNAGFYAFDLIDQGQGGSDTSSIAEIDDTFKEIVERTLNYNNYWRATIDGLDTGAIIGGVVYNYTYGIREVNNPAGFEFADYDVGINENDSAEGIKASNPAKSIIVNNKQTEEQKGSLRLKKVVTVDGNTPSEQTKSLVKGTYSFVITSKTLVPEVSKTVAITFNEEGTIESVVGENASLDENGYVTVSELKADDYTISEQTPENGSVLTEVKVTTGTGSVQGNVATVTVKGGETAEISAAEFTNNIETTSIKVQKEWGDDKDHSNVTIPFSVIQILPISDTDHTAKVYGDDYSVEGNGTVTVISDLPKYGRVNEQRVPYIYDIIEGNPGPEIYEAYTASRRTESDGVLVMVNTPVSDKDTHTNLSVEKIWKDGDQTVENTEDTISFRLERYEISTDYYPVEFTNNAYNYLGDRQAKSGVYYVPKNSKFEMNFRWYPFVGFGGVYYSVNGVRGDIPADGNVSVTINGPTKIDAGGWGTVYHAQPADGTTFYRNGKDLVEGEKQSGTEIKNGEFDYTYNYPDSTVTAAEGAPAATSKSNSWNADLNNLDEYIAASGKIYTYKITEVKINDDPVILGQTDDYTVSQVESPTEEGTKTTITNTKKEHTSLEVKKKWLNEDGDEMETKPAAIAKFRLTQHIINASSEELASKPYAFGGNNGIYELRNDNSWRQIFDSLPKTGTYTYVPAGADTNITVAVSYTYSVEEIAVLKVGEETDVTEDYDISYKFLVKDGDNPEEASKNYQIGESGTLTINNKAKSSVELPSTGGHGTALFMILGSILTLGAGVMLFRRRRLI